LFVTTLKTNRYFIPKDKYNGAEQGDVYTKQRDLPKKADSPLVQ
jgi:hypothetical protein